MYYKKYIMNNVDFLLHFFALSVSIFQLKFCYISAGGVSCMQKKLELLSPEIVFALENKVY